MTFLTPMPSNGASNDNQNPDFLLFKPHHFSTLTNCKMISGWNGTYRGSPGVYVWRKNKSMPCLDQLVFLPHCAEKDSIILKSVPTTFKTAAFSRKIARMRRNTEVPVDRVLQHHNSVQSSGWMDATPISPPGVGGETAHPDDDEYHALNDDADIFSVY